MEHQKKDLAAAMEQWLNKRTTRNLNLLSRLSGVSYATVRRLSMRECKPTAEVAAAILNVIMPKSEAIAMLRSEFPSFDVYLMNESNFGPAEADDLQLYYNSESHYPVLVLAQAAGGINETIVSEQLGKKYVPPFTELCENKILMKEGDNYHLTTHLGLASKEAARMHLKTLLNLTGSQNDERPSASGAFTLSARLNPSTVHVLKEKLANFHQELFKIIEDQNNEGEILWYGGWLNNILLNEEKL